MGKFNKVAGWVLASTLLTAPAFADIPPADACMAADEGEACDNAGENADQAGVCQQDTCTRATPDGPMTYDCFLCKVAAGGSGGVGNEGGANSEAGTKAEGGGSAEGGTATAGGPATGGSQSTAGSKPTGAADSEDDGGCNAAAVPVGGLASLVAPLLAFGLAAWCRRRARR